MEAVYKIKKADAIYYIKSVWPERKVESVIEDIGSYDIFVSHIQSLLDEGHSLEDQIKTTKGVIESLKA